MEISAPTAFPSGLSKSKTSLWLATVGLLTALLTLITLAVKDGPIPTQDVRIYNWIAGWDAPGLN